MSSRSVRIPGQLAARVEALGERERRRFAAMVSLLIEEALEARRSRTGAVPLPHVGPTGEFVDADAQPRDIDARRVT